MFRPLLLALAIATVAAPAWAQTRVELPIEAVRLSDGVVRYGVRLNVGGKSVLAGIDTGASGLRIMPDAAAGAKMERTTTPERYEFGSGARPAGVVARTRISAGQLSGEAAVHLVTGVTCEPRRPQCPGRLGLGYGFLGDGLPGEGFRVLLGLNMGPTSIDHPLRAIGAKRWIVELPRPGEAGSGKLVLNPDAAELAGFRIASLVGGFREQDGGGLHDAVAGCLRQIARAVCGLTTLDTGAAFVKLLNPPPGAPVWKDGATLTWEVQGRDRTAAASAPMTAGEPAKTVVYGTAPPRQPILQMGVWPYYDFAVLYDPDGRRLGFRAR